MSAKIKKISSQDQLKRVLADYQNLKKRIVVEKQAYVKFASASILDKFLPILDDLYRAQKHLKDSGIKIIIEQFNSLLQSESVTPTKVFHQEFDPQTMDCVELTKGSKNKVIEVVQTGYMLNDQILRPAKVKVGKGNK